METPARNGLGVDVAAGALPWNSGGVLKNFRRKLTQTIDDIDEERILRARGDLT